MTIASRMWLFFTCVILCSCTSLEKARNVAALPESATNIGNEGMVFAEIHIMAPDGDAANGMNVIVGEHSKGEIRNNSWGVALPAGDYAVEGLSRNSGATSGGFGGVNVTISSYDSYSVHRTFTVKPGEITNLGEIIIVPNPDPAKSREFKVFFVDNSSDASSLLKVMYPKLDLASMPSAMTLASGDYVRGDDLTKLRTLIAYVRAQSLPRRHYVVGPAGTLARIDRSKPDSPRVRLIETGTTLGLAGSSEEMPHDRCAFVSSDRRMFVYRAGHIDMRSLPQGVPSQPDVWLAGDTNIVIGARGFTFFTSADDGMNWSRNDSVADKSDATTYNFTQDSAGYFIHYFYPARVVYSPVGTPNFNVVQLPPDTKEIRQLTLTQSGLVLEPMTMVWSAKTRVPFYVRDRDGGEWHSHLLPGGVCQPLQFRDATGKSLRTTCGQVIYESLDGGENWRTLQ